jgi:hypothetical protein
MHRGVPGIRPLGKVLDAELRAGAMRERRGVACDAPDGAAIGIADRNDRAGLLELGQQGGHPVIGEGRCHIVRLGLEVSRLSRRPEEKFGAGQKRQRPDPQSRSWLCDVEQRLQLASQHRL